MIAYKKEWLDNLSIQSTAAGWVKKELISPEMHDDIQKKYFTGYKKWGIFARIGMFIFTIIILSSAFGLVNLFFNGHWSEGFIRAQMCFYGALYYIAAEYFIRENKFVFSGVIDALIYSSVFCMDLAIVLSFENGDGNTDPLLIFICVLPAISYTAVRFADALLALLAFACLVMINSLAIFKLGAIGKTILPFETMGLSFLLYYLIRKLKANEGLRYWNKCLSAIEVASLTLLYLAGNYMAIRILTEELLNITIEPGHDIGLAPLFYAYTILIPLVYLWLGLKRKDYIRIRLGLLLLVAGILSIKYYHHLMPPETAMILSGAFMIVAAYLCIRHLKVPRNGIVFESAVQSESHEAMVNIANVAISQAMSAQPVKANDTNFGGGDFGGGGAGSDF